MADASPRGDQATDVVGWSCMAVADEARAPADLNAHRAGGFDRAVADHGGRVGVVFTVVSLARTFALRPLFEAIRVCEAR